MKGIIKIIAIVILSIFAILAALIVTIYAICMLFDLAANMYGPFSGASGLIILLVTACKFAAGVFIAGIIVYCCVRMAE